jgi:hypothetical protein
VREDVEVPVQLVELQQEQVVFLPVLVQELREGWETSTFSEITLSSSNCDKLFNSNHKCWSQFCNKLVLVTRNSPN